MKVVENYGKLKALSEDLWIVDGEWEGSPLKRRMTVVRLPERRLLIHSAIAMRDEDLRELESLGTVSWVVVPNSFHGSEAGEYLNRFPQARLFTPAALRAKIAPKASVSGSIEEDLSRELPHELRVIPLRGARMHEAALVHRPSRTLVLTDAVFHLRSEYSGVLRAFLKLNGIFDRFGPSRIFRYLLVSDRRALRESLDRLLEEDFDRVVMSHGDVLERGGNKAVREAFVGW